MLKHSFTLMEHARGIRDRDAEDMELSSGIRMQREIPMSRSIPKGMSGLRITAWNSGQ